LPFLVKAVLGWSDTFRMRISRPRRVLSAALMVAGLMTIMPRPVAAQSTSPKGLTTLYGVVDARLLGSTPSQMNADLTQDQKMGANAIRAQLSWSAVEPSQGNFDWSSFDQVVSAVASHGMKLLVLVDFTPQWAAEPGCLGWMCQPADPSQFAQFAATAAARYGSQVAAWEIWNEPNSAGFWAPSPNAAAYSKLLVLTASAIRKADSGAYIVSGGLAPEANDGSDIAQLNFLSQMCSDGALSAVNAIAVHPYSGPVPPNYSASWNAWQQMENTSPSDRSILNGCGASTKPLWITEFGAPTNGPGPASNTNSYVLGATHVTEQLQAYEETQAIQDVASDTSIKAIFLYSSEDAGTSTTTNENFFGQVRANGTQKPAFTAISSAISSAKR
jgi:hypothetical protein